MKFPIKTLLVTLVALLLAVPTGAMAKPGNKGGHGHGKPAWASQGHGKADKAKGHGKADKAKAAHEKKDKKGMKFEAEPESEEDEGDQDELSLEDLEALEDIHAPGQYCHALESLQDSLAGMWGGQSFNEQFGTNDNLANSHGKCASWRAQGGELSEEEEATEEPAEDSCEPAEEEDVAAMEASGEEGSEEDSEEPAEEDCESEDPADDEPAEEEEGEESEHGESDEESGEDEQTEDELTFTFTFEFDFSFVTL